MIWGFIRDQRCVQRCCVLCVIYLYIAILEFILPNFFVNELHMKIYRDHIHYFFFEKGRSAERVVNAEFDCILVQR